MLNSFVLCVISVFSVVGIIMTVKYISALIISKEKNPQKIILYVKNQEDSIEGMVRILMRKYPYSEIIIVDYNSTDDTGEIIKKLSVDYPRIHIR